MDNMSESLTKLASVLEKMNTTMTQQTAEIQKKESKNTKKEKEEDGEGKKAKDDLAMSWQKVATPLIDAASSEASGASQLTSVIGMSAKNPSLAAAMASIYASQHIAAQQTGIPYGRFELEFAKYAKPREDMTGIAESLGASGIIKDKEWWSKTFEMKKTQREAMEENIKTMGQVSALAPTTEAVVQSLVGGMSAAYEKLAQVLDTVVKTQMQMWSFFK